MKLLRLFPTVPVFFMLLVVFFCESRLATADADPLEKSVAELEAKQKALRESPEYQKASPEERKKMLEELRDAWLDYGGGSSLPRKTEDEIVYDPAKGFGTVIGRVVDESARPLEKVKVMFRGYERGPGCAVRARLPIHAISGADGRFVADKVFAHWSVVELEMPWRFPVAQYLWRGDRTAPEAFTASVLTGKDSVLFSPAVVVGVEKDRTIDIGDVIFRQPVTIRGKVTLEGKPLPGVIVAQLKPGAHARLNDNLATRTDENGCFEYYILRLLDKEIVLGIYSPGNISKTSDSFMAARQASPNEIRADRTVVCNVDLKQFAEVEFELDTERASLSCPRSIGRFCYFYDETAPSWFTNLYFYSLEECPIRRFRVQPGTYDVYLTSVTGAPMARLDNVTLKPGEKRQEKLSVTPDNYGEVKGAVSFFYGKKDFTIDQLAAIGKDVRQKPNRPLSGPGDGDFLLFVHGYLYVFHKAEKLQNSRVPSYARPVEEGRFLLPIEKSPEGKVEAWIVRDAEPAEVNSQFFRATLCVAGSEPGSLGANLVRKVGEAPLLSGQAEDVCLRINVLDLFDAFFEWANVVDCRCAEELERPGPSRTLGLIGLDDIVQSRKEHCQALRDFLNGQKTEAGLGNEDAKRVDLILEKLVKYEGFLPFRVVRPQ